MTKDQLKYQALSLSVEDRLEIAEAIWESLEEDEAETEIPDWQRTLLDERISNDDANPDAGSPWPEVKQRILSSL